MGVGKNITWKKGKGKQCHFPYNIMAVGKNIRGEEENGDFGEENQDLKRWGWGRIQSFRELYTPLLQCRGRRGSLGHRSLSQTSRLR